jgi:hypothetical protein
VIHSNTNIVTKRIGPLWKKSQYRDTKDPCPVFDGKIWHIYGSGGAVLGKNAEEWEILHATAKAIEGPWTEQPCVRLVGLEGKHIAAPGVVYLQGTFHMFVQTEFLDVGGTIEYLTSTDGQTFTRISTALHSLPSTSEAALYDPHPAIVAGQKYLSYSASDFIGKRGEGSGSPWMGRPDIYLARSKTNTWEGPWERMGEILDHEDVVHHNQRDHLSYEWGLEGSQLIELPNGIIVMNAVCFLPHGEYGTRQRIFFAFAEKITGPYHTAGTVLKPSRAGWDSGENGHAAAFMRGPDMVLFYQARPPKLAPWRYGIARFNVRVLERIGKSTLAYYHKLSKVTKQTESNELREFADKIARRKTIVAFTDYVRELRSTVRKYRNRLKP